MFFCPQYRNFKNWVIWVDNCEGQNKCTHVHKVTLKYFTVGHSFMSADNFHRGVQNDMKSMDKVYDFEDFVKCISEVGEVSVMQPTNFYSFQNGLSESQASKKSRPLLADIYTVEFHQGSLDMFFKQKRVKEFKTAQFLKAKSKQGIKDMPKQQQENRGITSKKKKAILSNLSSLMPVNCRPFFERLPINENSTDLVTERE